MRLKGKAPNTYGTGARIQLVGASFTQSQEMICAGRYLSCDQAVRVFAADFTTNKPMRLEVRWRNGEQTTLTNILANRVYEIEQAGSAPSAASNSIPVQNLFSKKWPCLRNPCIREAFFDDWSRQPLLPRRLSRLGPGVSCYDFNGDGWEDFIFGTGRGGKMAIYTNDHSGGFTCWKEHSGKPGDQCGLVGWARWERQIENCSPQSPIMKCPAKASLRSIPSPIWPSRSFSLRGRRASAPLALADIDGDGDLDLFIGGRFEPGQYPKPVSSLVWLNDNGELRPSAELSKPFESIGMVSGATFADLDGDGRPIWRLRSNGVPSSLSEQ